MTYSVFSWTSKGGNLRRQLLEINRKKALDAAAPDLQRQAQEVADQSDRNLQEMEQGGASGLGSQLASRGSTSPFTRGAAVARKQEERKYGPGRQAQRDIARAFEPEPNLFQRQASIFNKRAQTPSEALAAIDRDRLERGGKAATAFREQLGTGPGSIERAAGLKAFASVAEQNRGYLETEYPRELPSAALKRRLEERDFEAESMRSAIQGPEYGRALNDIIPNDLGDRIFNKGVELATQSVLPERVTEPISRIPLVGEQIEDVVRQNTSPFALASLAVPALRAGVIASAVGQTVGGVAGEQAVKAGAPGWVDPALEIGGAVLGPGVIPGAKRLLPSESLAARVAEPVAERAAVGAVDDVSRGATALAEDIPVHAPAVPEVVPAVAAPEGKMAGFVDSMRVGTGVGDSYKANVFQRLQAGESMAKSGVGEQMAERAWKRGYQSLDDVSRAIDLGDATPIEQASTAFNDAFPPAAALADDALGAAPAPIAAAERTGGDVPLGALAADIARAPRTRGRVLPADITRARTLSRMQPEALDDMPDDVLEEAWRAAKRECVGG